MDMNKFTNTTSWEPYNIALMEEHHHQAAPFDQWPYNSSYHNILPNIESQNEASSTQQQLPPSPSPPTVDVDEPAEDHEELGAMKEMMFKIAAMQPVDIDPATIRKPRRRNVRISDDPQSVAARHRRERISEKIRILQRLVPGGTKMDTASMLDEAIRYVKFLKRQIRMLQGPSSVGIPTATTASGTSSYFFGGNISIINDGAAGDDHPGRVF